MELAELQRETRSSIELTRNSKGDYQWVIKSYYEEEQADVALKVINGIDVVLRAEYLPKGE